MTAQAIRQAYLDFMQEQGHTIIPRANLVPQDDPTTLFTGSGMQPLLPYLLGAEHPEGKRLADSQTCLRADDIEEVGDNRHTTFFEMLGNWSLGDYFKEQQLEQFLTFLIEKVGLEPAKLYMTCYIGSDEYGIPKDTETSDILVRLLSKYGVNHGLQDVGSEADGYRLGMDDQARIFFYDGTKNWWSRSGPPDNMPEGEPGGPDCEVFYDFETTHDPEYGEHCHPNCDCGRFMEIGNSVFMEYIRTADGFDQLPQKNVDFGMGLERIAAAKLGSDDMFQISLMKPIIEQLETLSSKPYEKNQSAMRIIADHMRAAVWLAVDGIAPSNKEQGYVVRRLVRRAILAAHELGIEQHFAADIVPVVIDIYKHDFSEVAEQAETVEQLLVKEEKIFRQTLRKGIHVFEKEVAGSLTGADVFKLYDTFGFPTELSLEQAHQRSITIDPNWQHDFDHLMAEQKARSRTATKGQFKGGLGGQSDAHRRLHTATHLLYATLRQVLGDHVIQRGANITEERLRFDFEHPQKLTDAEKAEVERRVNEQIEAALPVSHEEIKTDTALAAGALGQFGDKYGDNVKVYSMGEGDDRYSFEICGGPHADNTADLAKTGHFTIVKEQSSSAGVRRIKAVLK